MTSFDNSFEDFSPNSSCDILSDSKDSISSKFRDKINKFKISKLNNLIQDLKSNNYHDETVYTGSAGLAFYYLMSSINKSPICLDTLQEAASCINLSKLKGRRISFLCGDAGPLAIMAVISYKLGAKRTKDIPDFKILIERLLSLSSLLNSSPDELLYGKVGYLYALLFVNNNIDVKNIIPTAHIQEVANAVVKSGKLFSSQMKSPSPLLWQWHDKIYLGAAHGMAGILFMLLQARAYIEANDVRAFIKPSIDWLLDQRLSSGNFPSSIGSSTGDRLVQWCHGAPGFVPLCILSYQVFSEERYLKIAVQCGDVVWQRGLCTKGYSICHGVSGNAYTFLQLYQATKNGYMCELVGLWSATNNDMPCLMRIGKALNESAIVKWPKKPIYLYRACAFTEWCALERSGTELHPPDRPTSLFEGVIGRIYLAEDIINPLNSKFPAFYL